jgi:hypothetical protein
MTFRLPKDCLARSSLMVRRMQELASFCTRCSASRWITDESCQKRQNDEVSCDCLSLLLLPLPFSLRRLPRRPSGIWTAYVRADNRPRNRSPGVVAGGIMAIGTVAGCIAAMAMGRASTCTSAATGTDGTEVGATAATGRACGALAGSTRNVAHRIAFAAAMGIRSSRAGGRADKSGQMTANVGPGHHRAITV